MRKGQVTIYLAFIISAVMIIMITAVFAPMGVLFGTEMFTAGEGILIRANDSIQNIQDATIRQQIEDANNAAISAGQQNIEVSTDLFQYAWVFLIVLTGLVAFLFTRQITEFQLRSGGGFV